VLRPRLRLGWVRLLLAVSSIVAAFGLAWAAWLGPAAGQAAVSWPAMAVLFGAALSQLAVLKPLLLYRDRFDRQAGRLTLGWFGLKGTYPLARVLAVQLIPGGLAQKTPAPFRRGGECVSYQLNLVMADAYEDRLNITEDADLAWTRQAGQQVADFLGVPLLDQIADSE
jgi:hypothetical protein